MSTEAVAPVETGNPGGDPRDAGDRFFDQRYPRVGVWKETLAALKLANVDDVTAFCNEAIQYAVKSGHASNATLADVVAGIAALNSRARELTVVQLELMAITLDISLLAEHLTMAAPLLDDILAAQDRARRAGTPGAKP